ncbi:heparan-alpha-glucosaminide N-acetyltransferase domain-containing protein [Arthrobacter sp. H20]|uniref:heparan-alpha-glucosaminide N-acetyltransferase domain-containing protein n=1 Tax=Arthrobacter sp. H20 TaxID=1267981 RepID=UPI00047DEDCC|nr:heparan-alpha-glucosaminide N-acetyltransferase domain-containing protein [Arthrobacter sp. H20]
MVSPSISRRVSGVDAARGVALLGMMSTHIFALYVPGTADASWVAQVFSGRASALFAVVAGLGLALLTGGCKVHDHRAIGMDRRGIAARAAIIMVIGLMLGGLETNIAIILFHYGVLFLLALPFVSMRVSRLIWWAVGWTVLSPVAAYLLRPWILETVNPPSIGGNPLWQTLLEPATLLADITVTGYYPALQWLSYLLIGLVIGRLPLKDLRVQLGLVVSGLVLAVAAKLASGYLLGPLGGLAALLETPDGSRYPLEAMMSVSLTGVEQSDSWWWLAVSAPHSGSPLDLLHTSGTAALVIGLCLLATRKFESGLLPLSATGAMTLTLYTIHIWTMSVVDAQDPVPEPSLVYWGQVVVFIVLGILFQRINARGPLELVTSGASRAARSGLNG